MITLIEALNYRCLRYISKPLKPFHVLVGPNASGKTTFLDVVSFLQEMVSDGRSCSGKSHEQSARVALSGRGRQAGIGCRGSDSKICAILLRGQIWYCQIRSCHRF